jgi:hypothetical protein
MRMIELTEIIGGREPRHLDLALTIMWVERDEYERWDDGVVADIDRVERLNFTLTELGIRNTAH